MDNDQFQLKQDQLMVTTPCAHPVALTGVGLPIICNRTSLRGTDRCDRHSTPPQEVLMGDGWGPVDLLVEDAPAEVSTNAPITEDFGPVKPVPQPGVNVHLMRAVVSMIEAYPAAWDQTEWVRKVDKTPEHPCGTTFCLAGWTLVLTGYVKHNGKLTKKGKAKYIDEGFFDESEPFGKDFYITEGFWSSVAREELGVGHGRCFDGGYANDAPDEPSIKALKRNLTRDFGVTFAE